MSRPFCRGSAKSSGPLRSTIWAWSFALPSLNTLDPSLLLALPDPTSDTTAANRMMATITPAAALRITMRLRLGLGLRLISPDPPGCRPVDSAVAVSGGSLVEGGDDGEAHAGGIGLGHDAVDDAELQQVGAGELESGRQVRRLARVTLQDGGRPLRG